MNSITRSATWRDIRRIPDHFHVSPRRSLLVTILRTIVALVVGIAEVEVLENREGIGGQTVPLDLRRMAAVALVEVGTAHGAEPLAARPAEHHVGRLHDERGRERLREVDRMVIADEEVVKVIARVIAVGVLGLLEEVVPVDLAGDIERSLLEAAVTDADDVRRKDACDEDALAGVGERDVVVDARRQRKGMVPERIAILVDMPGNGQRVTGVAETLVKSKDHRVHAGYQGTLLDVLRGPEFSSRVWRTRPTELVSDLRFSSRWERTVSAYSSAL